MDEKGRRIARGAFATASAGEAGGKGRSRPFSRRALVAGAGAAAIGLVLWRALPAFGDTGWWDGSTIFRGNGAWYANRWFGDIGAVEGNQGGTIYTDRTVAARTPWVEWDISANQFIRTATKLTCACDFTTELYYHVNGRLEIACGSYNGNDAGYPLWHYDSDDDVLFALYAARDGGEGSEHSRRIANLSNDWRSASAGGDEVQGVYRDGSQAWTDYREWAGGNAYDVWIRREAAPYLLRLQLRSWFWDYYYYGTSWYLGRGQGGDRDAGNAPIGYATQWMQQTVDGIYIGSNLAWSHRILEVLPRADQSKALDVAEGAVGDGASLCIWGRGCTTNQNWAAAACEDAERRGCLSFQPVHTGSGAYLLDHAGSGPTKGPAAAHLWTANGNRAQALWVHDGGAAQWLFSDCSGLALDLVNGSTADGTGVQFHSSGYAADEWSNTSHQWVLEDAVFRLNAEAGYDELPLQGLEGGEARPGRELALPDLGTYCRPANYGSTAGMAWDYCWVALDAGDGGEWLSDPVEVMGAAYVIGVGWLTREQPALNLVGTVGQDRDLGGVRLRVEGSSLPGGISYGLRWMGAGWIDASDGAACGYASDDRRYDLFRASLEGELAEKYDVAYRAYSWGVGWGEWARDGEAAGTEGKAIQGMAVRIEPRGPLAAYWQGTPAYTPGEDLGGKKVACVVRARQSGGFGLSYRGIVATAPVLVRHPFVEVRCYADGEEDPCWTGQAQPRRAYAVPDEARRAAQKPACSGFDGWYVDRSCTVPFEDGTVLGDDALDLYGRSVARVSYACTEGSRALFANRACCFDEAMTQPFDVSAALPSGHEVFYGDRVVFSQGRSAWYEGHGKVREAVCARGAYATAEGAGTPALAARITGDTVAYLAWRLPEYDGISVS